MKLKILVCLTVLAASGLSACTGAYVAGDAGRHRVLYDPAARHIEPDRGWYDVGSDQH